MLAALKQEMPMVYWGTAGIVAGLLTVGCASVTVEKVTGKADAEGLLYALPNTVVRVQLKVERLEKSGAPYAAYAGIFAPEGRPVCEDAACTLEQKVTYTLQPGAMLTTYGEPDPANVYLVKFTGGGVIDQSLSMTWSEAGLLTAATSSVTNRTVELATAGVKLLTGVASKAAYGSASAKGVTIGPCPGGASATDGWVIARLQHAGTPASDTLIANYCALDKPVREALLRNDALLSGAVTAWTAKVLPLITAQRNVLSGTIQSVDPGALLSKLAAELDQALTALFIGKKASETWDGTVDVRDIAVDAPVAVLGLDPSRGICRRDGATVPPDSKPIPAGFQRLTAAECAAASPITLTFQWYPAVDRQLFSKIADHPQGKRSFRYRIPAQVSAIVSGPSDKTQGTAVLRIAQLGTVISLPAGRHSKNLSYELNFVEATGALKSFKLGTTGGLDSATVDAISSTGGSLLDARDASRKNAGDTAVLTEEAQQLTLEDEICTIKRKYGVQCTLHP